MQPDDARALIAAVGKLPPELQAAGRRRVAERLADEGVVDLAEGRVYRFKHGWIPLTHAAALRVTHGDHAKANALLAKHHGSDGSHTARVTPSKHGGFNVVHRGELQANWNTEKDAVKHAAKLNATKASGARVAPSAHGGFNVVHKGKLQANWASQGEADAHAARLNSAARPKVRTSERTLASRQPSMGRDKVAKGFVPQPSAADKAARQAYGKPYVEGVAYTKGGQGLEMRRKGQRVQFFDVNTHKPVGPEQGNVAPAVAWAHSNGYRSGIAHTASPAAYSPTPAKVGGGRRVRTSAELSAAAAAKRAEAERIANSAGVGDRAAGRLSAPGLAQAHRSTDSQLRRYTEASAQAGNLEHSAGLAAAREREAARVRLTHEQIKGATHVKDQHGTWREVVRVNPKSVTVTTGHSWNDTIPHEKVHGVRTLTPAALQSVLDNPKASDAVKAEARRLLAKGKKK